MNDTTTFGGWLRQRRKAFDLTQEQLADRVSCSTETIRKIEADRRRPSRQMVDVLAQRLAVPLEERPALAEFARLAHAVGGEAVWPPFQYAGDERPEGSSAPGGDSGLPSRLTTFVGRHDHIEAIRSLLRQQDVRLLTLTGAGGTGKTRLAIRVARELAGGFAAGASFVSLEALTDPGLVASTIAQTLKLRETPGHPLVQTLKAYLRDKQLLLLLDNFEQVLGAATIVGELLAEAPGLKVMVTSREPLQLSGEHIFPVSPLALPEQAELPSLEDLSGYEAVDLFVQRARLVKHDFQLTEENADAVVQICRRLDGLPLAIELAAARIRVLPPQALQARMESRLSVLTGGASDIPARHQALRNTIDWSYDLLDEEQRRLFGRLAVFAGGCTLQAVSQACHVDGDLEVDTLDAMASLLDKSLLRQTPDASGEPRFSMLETIREYATEVLAQSPEAATVHFLHAEFFATLAEQSRRELEGPSQLKWLERLDEENDNLRAALQWSLSASAFGGEPELEVGLRLAGALKRFWERRYHLTEGRHWLGLLLARARTVRARRPTAMTSSFASALDAAARLAYKQGDVQATRELYEESLDLFGELEDPYGTSLALVGLGHAAEMQDDLPGARSLYEQALEYRRRLGDKSAIASALMNLGRVEMTLGDTGRSAELFHEAITLSRELGDDEGISYVLEATAHIHFLRGEYGTAAQQTEEAIALYAKLRNKENMADALVTLAWLAVYRGDYTRAEELLDKTSVLYRESEVSGANIGWPLCLSGIVAAHRGDPEGAAERLTEGLALFRQSQPPLSEGIGLCLLGFAEVARGRGEPVRAARLMGAAGTLYDSVGIVGRAYASGEMDSVADRIRAQLDQESFAAAWGEGRAMSTEQAIELALGTRSALHWVNSRE